jgi:hypothetical protein
MKDHIEKLYVAKKKNVMEVKNKDKKVIIVIDDLNLDRNYNTNVMEFIRTWSNTGGYYDVKNGVFKNIGDFGCLMAENSNYRND